MTIQYSIKQLDDEPSVERERALSTAQREAVRQFLLLRLSDNYREFDHQAIEAALANHWTAKSES